MTWSIQCPKAMAKIPHRKHWHVMRNRVGMIIAEGECKG